MKGEPRKCPDCNEMQIWTNKGYAGCKCIKSRNSSRHTDEYTTQQIVDAIQKARENAQKSNL